MNATKKEQKLFLIKDFMQSMEAYSSKERRDEVIEARMREFQKCTLAQLNMIMFTTLSASIIVEDQAAEIEKMRSEIKELKARLVVPKRSSRIE